MPLTDTRNDVRKTLRTSDNASDPAVSWKVKCLNCGAALAGPFCAECGQRALPPHPTVRELIGDALVEFSGWDGKLAETVRVLLRKPGELTRQWIEGRRAHFISPLRLYLASSLLYFLTTAGAPNLRPNAQTGKLDIGGLQIGATGSTRADKISEEASKAIRTKTGLTGATRDSALANLAAAPMILQPMLRRAITEPAAFSNAVREAMPRVFFALVPAFAGILALFYRRRHYPEHLYFAIHIAAFLFLARGLGNLALYTGSLPFAVAVQLITAIWIAAYGYMSLRKVYGGSPVATTLKGIGICVLYALIAAPVILTVAVIVGS